jgi:hypothetical protein
MPPEEGEEIGEVVVSLHLGRITDKGVYVRRLDRDGVVFLVGPELLELLRPGAWQFRSKEVFRYRPGALRPSRIEKRGIAGDETAEFRDGSWTADAHPDRVDGIIDHMLRLSADRWVGSAPGRESEYGLSEPEGSVRVTFGDQGPGKTYGVLLGKETRGGRFARAVREGKPGEAVFVIAETDLPLLCAPLPMPDEPEDGGGEEDGK